MFTSPALAHNCPFCTETMTAAKGKAWFQAFRCDCGAKLQVFSDGSKTAKRTESDGSRRVIIEDVPRPKPTPRDDRLDAKPIRRPGVPVLPPGLPVARPNVPVIKPGLPILRPGRSIGIGPIRTGPRDNRYWTVSGRVFSKRAYRGGRTRVYSKRTYAGKPLKR